jgi:NAD(P)-dependent dehydrogenase (short-subunit alcohol dehydrogenase family)
MKNFGRTRIILSSILPQRKAPDPRHAIPDADKQLQGKTIVFTGGTDGMGRVAAQMLFEMGASLVLLGRDAEKGDRIVAELRESGGEGTARFVVCDLSSMASVRASAAQVLDLCPRIDVLVNCAGANVATRKITPEGFEANWAINFLGPFLLTNLLCERLVHSAPARIVNLSSATEAMGHLQFDDLSFEDGFTVEAAYAQAKLAINAFTVDLSRRLQGTGVTVNALNPGFIQSNLLREHTGFRALARPMMRAVASPPEVGADRIVRLAVSSEFDGVSGEFVYEDAIRPPNAEALDPAVVARLMQESHASTGLRAHAS